MGNCWYFSWIFWRTCLHHYVINRSRGGHCYSFTIIWQRRFIYSFIHGWIFIVYCSDLMLLLGVFLYNEPFTQAHIITFTLIWVSLVMYMFSSFQQHKKTKTV